MRNCGALDRCDTKVLLRGGASAQDRIDPQGVSPIVYNAGRCTGLNGRGEAAVAIARRHMVERAYAVLERDGLKGFTLGRVAAVCEMTKGHLHHYFATRRA